MHFVMFIDLLTATGPTRGITTGGAASLGAWPQPAAADPF